MNKETANMTSLHRPQRLRWTLERARIHRRTLRQDPRQEYFAYVPSSCGDGAPLLVAVHGISRNAQGLARALAPACEALGVVLAVPHFTPEDHGYQRLGDARRNFRADRLLDSCVAEITALSGADSSEIFLFGHSGGAQFCHRYLMAHPTRVARATLMAAGWYTFPDPLRKFPYGIRTSRALPDISFNPEQFLRIPIEVLVGSDDLGRKSLRSTRAVIEQQGATRVERARRWTAAMQAAAYRYGLPSQVRLTEVPNVGHDFEAFRTRGDLVDRVFESLFFDRPSQCRSEVIHG